MKGNVLIQMGMVWLLALVAIVFCLAPRRIVRDMESVLTCRFPSTHETQRNCWLP